MTVRASIIIPVWKGRAYLADCLTALLAELTPEDEIIAVDNASPDDSAELIARDFPIVRLIRSPANRGFSGGCNLGMAAARGAYCLLLNQDVVVQRGCLAALLQALAADERIGIVGGKGLYPDNRVQHAGGRLEWPRGVVAHWGYAQPDGLWDTPRDVDFVTGAALGMRRALVERLGPLDEGFWPGYYEDVDYCLRARAAGYRIRYCPEAVYIHQESTSTETAARAWYTHRGRLRLSLKHMPPARWRREFVPAEAAAQPQEVQAGQGRALRLAYQDTARKLPELLRDRPEADDALFGQMLTDLQELGRALWRLETLGGRTALRWPLNPVDLQPDYVQTLQTRQGEAAEPWTWAGFREYQFRSSLPLVGPLVARLRRWWFAIAARWAVLFLMQQQEALNRDLYARIADLMEDNLRLAEQLTAREAWEAWRAGGRLPRHPEESGYCQPETD